MRLRLANPHTGSPLGEFWTQNGGAVQGDKPAQTLMNGRTWRRQPGARSRPRVSGLKLEDQQGNPLTPDDGDDYLKALQDYFTNSQSVSIFNLPDDPDQLQEAKRPRGLGPSEPKASQASRVDPAKATGERALSDLEHAERVLAGRKSGQARHARAESHETAIDKIIRERREARRKAKAAKTKVAKQKTAAEFAAERERTAKGPPTVGPAPTVPVVRAAPTVPEAIPPGARPRRAHVEDSDLKSGETYFTVHGPKAPGAPTAEGLTVGPGGAWGELKLRTRSERAADDLVKKNPEWTKQQHVKGVTPSAKTAAAVARTKAPFVGRRVKAEEHVPPGDRIHYDDGGTLRAGTIIEHRHSKRDGHRVLIHDDRSNAFRVVPRSTVKDVKPRASNKGERDMERRQRLEALAVQASGQFNRAHGEKASHDEELGQATARHESLIRQHTEATTKVAMIGKLPKEQRPTGIESIANQRRVARNLEREIGYSQTTLDELRRRSPGSQVASARTNLAAAKKAATDAGGVAPPDARAQAKQAKADATKAVADAQADLDRKTAAHEAGDYATKRVDAIDAETQAAKALAQARRDHDQVSGTLKGTKGHHRVLAQAAIDKAAEDVAAREKEHAQATKQTKSAHQDYIDSAGGVAKASAHLSIAQAARDRLYRQDRPRGRAVKKPEDVQAMRPGDVVHVAGGGTGTVVRNYKVGKKHKLLVHLHDTGEHPIVGRARVPGMPGGPWAKVPDYIPPPTSAVSQLQVISHENVTHTSRTQTLGDRKGLLRAARTAAHAERSDTMDLPANDRSRRDAASYARRADESLRDLGENVPDISRRTAAQHDPGPDRPALDAEGLVQPPEPRPAPEPLERRAAGPNIKPSQMVAYLDQPLAPDEAEPEKGSYHEHPAAANLPDEGKVIVHTGGGVMQDVPYENLHPMHGREYQRDVRGSGLIEQPEPAPHPAFEPQTRWMWGAVPPDELHPSQLRPGDEIGFARSSVTGGTSGPVERLGQSGQLGSMGHARGIVLPSSARQTTRVYVPSTGQTHFVPNGHIHHVRQHDVAGRLENASELPAGERAGVTASIDKDRRTHRRVAVGGKAAWLRSPSYQPYQESTGRGFEYRWPAWADDRPGEVEIKRSLVRKRQVDTSSMKQKEETRDLRYRTGGNLNDAEVVKTNRQGLLEAAFTEAAAKHTGAMIALYPPKHLADKLAVPGGEKPDDMHVTLAFLGKADQLKSPEMVKAVARSLAERHPPISGAMSGHGVFTQGADAPVTYASADLPALPGFRQKLVRLLHATGHTPSGEHGFTPHMTLAYGTPKVSVPATPVTFDTLSAVIAGERHDYPFAGHLREGFGGPKRSRYTISGSAGSRGRKRYAVLDNHDLQGGKGKRRVSFHATGKAAQAEARRLNELHERGPKA